MRAQASEQFTPSSAWRAAQRFLEIHGRPPDGEELPAELVQVLMIGVWAGCRFAVLDHTLGLAIAAFGNEQSGPVFEGLRRGFASEFGEPMRQAVHDALYERGFTHAWAELVEAVPEAPAASGAVEAAQDVLRKLRERGLDGDDGGTP